MLKKIKLQTKALKNCFIILPYLILLPLLCFWLFKANELTKELQAKSISLSDSALQLQDIANTVHEVCCLSQELDKQNQLFVHTLLHAAGRTPPLPSWLEAELGNLETPANNRLAKCKKLLASTAQKVTNRYKLLDPIPSTLPTHGRLTSKFGIRVNPIHKELKMHQGIDIAAAPGTPIYATAPGKVIYAGKSPSFGYSILVLHAHGIKTRYGHNRRNLVKAGETISQGQMIAEVGSTGHSTSAHLHYEVLVRGKPVNPELFIFEDAVFSHQEVQGKESLAKNTSHQ